jgi:streptogrisin C
VVAFLAALVLALLAPRGPVLHAREAPSTQPSTPSGPSSDPTTHATPDASSYAARYGVGKAEAERRLALQAAAGEVEARLSGELPGAYGGLYLSHEPRFAVTVRLSSAGPEDARRARQLAGDAAPGLQSVLDVLPARYSLADLRHKQAEAARAASASDLDADTSIDVRENRVEVSAPRAPEGPAPLAARAKDPTDGVAVIVADETIRPAALSSGGEKVTTKCGNGYCTSGFSVRSAAGVPGVTTAAHCPNRLFARGARLPYRAGKLGGSSDLQWHATPRAKDAARVHDGSGYRKITGSVARDAQPVGGWVCKYGVRTKRTCGTISGKWYAPAYIPNAKATFVGVSSRRAVVLPGDSGGPFFSGTSAYGTTVAYSRSGTTHYGYYMPADYLSELGLRLAVAR